MWDFRDFGQTSYPNILNALTFAHAPTHMSCCVCVYFCVHMCEYVCETSSAVLSRIQRKLHRMRCNRRFGSTCRHRSVSFSWFNSHVRITSSCRAPPPSSQIVHTHTHISLLFRTLMIAIINRATHPTTHAAHDLCDVWKSRHPLATYMYIHTFYTIFFSVSVLRTAEFVIV